MPDRDVFDRHVQREWRKVARLLLSAEVDPSVLQKVMRHLGDDFRRKGCPGFDQIVSIVVEAASSDQSMEIARQVAVNRLEQTRRCEGASSTEIAVGAANVVLAELMHYHEAVVADQKELELRFAAQILAELAAKRMNFSSLLPEMVEHNLLSYQTMAARIERTKRSLRSSPDMRALAAQILQDPSGRTLKLPRRRKESRSQADLLVSTISE